MSVSEKEVHRTAELTDSKIVFECTTNLEEKENKLCLQPEMYLWISAEKFTNQIADLVSSKIRDSITLNPLVCVAEVKLSEKGDAEIIWNREFYATPNEVEGEIDWQEARMSKLKESENDFVVTACGERIAFQEECITMMKEMQIVYSDPASNCWGREQYRYGESPAWSDSHIEEGMEVQHIRDSFWEYFEEYQTQIFEDIEIPYLYGFCIEKRTYFGQDEDDLPGLLGALVRSIFKRWDIWWTSVSQGYSWDHSEDIMYHCGMYLSNLRDEITQIMSALLSAIAKRAPQKMKIHFKNTLTGSHEKGDGWDENNYIEIDAMRHYEEESGFDWESD